MRNRRSLRVTGYLLPAVALLASCAVDGFYPPAASDETQIVISVPDQRLALLEHGKIVRTYIVSTAKNGVGEAQDSDATPRGLHAIAEKIGAGLPAGMVFDSRVPTGEIIGIDEPGRWPVVTRILRLKGLEERNMNSFDRMIYVHGSPVERLLGTPASGGCIRLRSEDVIELFERVQVGTVVNIVDAPLASHFKTDP